MKIHADVLCARQPILDTQNHIFAYEVLYRTKQRNRAEFKDGDNATRELLLNACSSISDDDTLHQYPIFFHTTANLLLTDCFPPIDTQKVIISVQNDMAVNEHILSAMRRLIKLGYQFAVKNYDFAPERESLLTMVKFVEVDVSSVELSELKQRLAPLKEKNKVLIAGKVESHATFEACLGLGFDLFQGFYLEKPQIVKGKKLGSNINLALTLINRLQESEVCFEDVAYLVSQDPKLSFQLIKILNSPAQGLKREISSLKQAVTFLGIEALKKWVVLISLLQNSEAPEAFFVTLLSRARTCEQLALFHGSDEPDSLFTIGLFSGLDRVLNIDFRDIVKQLNLSNALQDALLYHKGKKGAVLEKVMQAERGDWIALRHVGSWSEANLICKLAEEAREWATDLLATTK